MPSQIVLWVGFNLFVLVMLALDLGVFHRKAHTVSFREALIWSIVWVSLALGFNFLIHLWYGPRAGMQFLTGYLIEKSLSVDNIFVFLLIFSYFNVPAPYQHKVLFWGILSALLMRAAMIVMGAALIHHFHGVIYLFGTLLVVTAIRMALKHEEDMDPERNPAIRLLRRLMPVTPEYHQDHFFVRKDGRLWATPLFVALVAVEVSDVIFAVDSIPAIFAVTRDPFIVYTSNVFAILGLRSLFFVLAGMLGRFCYLKWGLAAVLAFVGCKMLLSDLVHIPIGVSLAVIAGILTATILGSLLWPRRSDIAACVRRIRIPRRRRGVG